MAKTKALVRRVPVSDPRHLLRYLKYEASGGDEEAMRRIAKEEGVSLATVKASVLQVDAYKKTNTASQMDIAMRDLVISSIPQAKATLEDLLTATELVEEVDSKTGRKKVKTVADKTTRLEAMKIFNSIMSTLQPKGPAVEVNVNQTNQTANINSGSESNEERFARLRKQAEAHNALPPETAAVPEYVDAGEDAPDDDQDDDEEGED
jgi:hypothetical protein